MEPVRLQRIYETPLFKFYLSFNMKEINLDLKDKKILAELEMNARINHSELAKKVRLSKQVVKYRVERLEKEKIIQGYNAIVDVNKLGETIYLIYLKLINISSQKEALWIKSIEKNSSVMAVGKNAGHWDLSIVIRCRNNQELDKIFKNITSGKSDKIKEKLVTSEIESSYFNLGLLLKAEDMENSTSNLQANLSLDEDDEELTKLLAKDCRTSLIDLAEKLSMSPNGVKDKIKRLEKRGIIIGYKTKINYESLGYLHFRVFVRLNNFSDALYKKIKDFLKSNGNVESVSRYLGYSDVDFRCYAKDITNLYKLISDIKDNFLGEVIEIDSIPIFGWEKINYYPK